MGLINWFKRAIGVRVRSIKIDTEGNAKIVYIPLGSVKKIGEEIILCSAEPYKILDTPVLIVVDKLDMRGEMGYIEKGAVKL